MKLLGPLLLLVTIALAGCNPKIGEPIDASLASTGVDNNFSLAITNQYYVQTQNIDIVLTHPAVVSVTGTPKLSLDIGGSIVDASYVSGSGSTSLIFRYTVVMNDLDTDGIEIDPTLDLNGGSMTFMEDDSPVNANTSLSLPNLSGVKVDAIIPTISAVNLPAAKTYYLNENLDFTVQFSENVIITGAPKLTLDIGGTVVDAMYQSGSGTNSIIFRRTVDQTNLDLDGPSIASPLILNSGSIRDIAGNNANLSFLPPNASSVIINGHAPIITSINKPANGTYLFGQDLEFFVNFNKNVSVTGTPTIALDIGGKLVALSYVSGSGSARLLFSYNIQAGEQDSNGIEINQTIVLNGGTIRGTSNYHARLSFNIVPLGVVFVQAILPTIISVTTPANDLYETNDNLYFTATFSEVVSIVGAPRIAITLNSGTVYANYLTGSGTTNITFRYTVAASDLDNNGIALVTPLELNSGTIKNNFNTDALLAFTAPSTSGITINNFAPYVASITPPANGSYVENNNIDFSLAWSESINVSGSPRLVLNIGGVTRYAAYQAGLSNASTSVFRYTVQAGDSDNNGIGITASVDLNGGTIQNAALVNATLTFIAPNLAAVLVVSNPPTIVSVTAPANATYLASQNLDFIVNWSEAVTVTGTRLILDIGGVTRYATYFSGSPGANITYRYTVQAPDEDLNGIGLTASVDLNGGSIVNASNTNGVLTFTAPSLTALLVDTLAPTITSVTPPVNDTYGSSEALNFTINFSESVTITGATSYIALDIGGNAKQAICAAGSGTTATCSYTVVNGDSDLNGIEHSSPVVLAGSTMADAAGNNLVLTFTPANTTGVLVSAVAPTITSVTAPANAIYTETQNLDFVVNFSESVTVTGTRLAIVIGATTRYAAYLSGSPSANITYRYTVVNGDDDSNGIAINSPLELNGGSIVSGGSQNAELTFTPPNTTGVLVDTTVPTITSVTPPANGSYKQNDQLIFTVNFSESVTITGATSYVALDIGGNARQAICAAGTGTSAACSYTVQAAENDSNGIGHSSPLVLAGSTIKDVAGNDLVLTFTPANTTAVLVDTTAPTITSVTPPTNGTYGSSNALNFTINFSESVTITGATSYIALDIGGVAKQAICAAGSGTSAVCSYTVVNGDSDLNGIEHSSPVVLAGSTMADAAGNNLVLTFTPANTTGVLVDTTAPTITSVTPPVNDTYGVGGNLTFNVNFSETVIVSGVPKLNLNIGGVSRQANYVSGSNSTTLVFTYTVVAGETDNNGIETSSPLVLDGGSIADAAGNNATLTFTLPNTSGVLVDAQAPIIVAVTKPTNGSYKLNDILSYVVEFSEAVTVAAGTPSITLDIGGITRNATLSSGSGSQYLTFSYTVQAGDEDTDGITNNISIALNGSTIRDANFNDADLLIGAQATTGVLVDTIAPTIAITTPAESTLITSATSSATYSVAGTCSENGQTVNIKVDAVNAASQVGFVCDGVNFSGTIDVTALAQGAHSMTATISDLAGNTTESSGINFTIDTVGPQITSITMPANQAYTTGQTLNFTVNFDDNAFVTGTPRIAITFTSGTVYANYVSGSTTTALLFSYTIGSGDTSSPSITLVSPLDLNGGTIKDNNNNNATLTFSPPANTIEVNLGVAEFQWQYTDGTPVTLHDFGNPGANTSITLQVKNIGTATSGTPTVTLPANGSGKVTLGTNNCTAALAVNATCTVTFNWAHKMPTGTHTGKGQITATPGNTTTVNIRGTR